MRFYIRQKGMGEVLTATDRCTTGLEEIDVVLFLQALDLVGRQASVGKHSVL